MDQQPQAKLSCRFLWNAFRSIPFSTKMFMSLMLIYSSMTTSLMTHAIDSGVKSGLTLGDEESVYNNPLDQLFYDLNSLGLQLDAFEFIDVSDVLYNLDKSKSIGETRTIVQDFLKQYGIELAMSGDFKDYTNDDFKSMFNGFLTGFATFSPAEIQAISLSVIMIEAENSKPYAGIYSLSLERITIVLYEQTSNDYYMYLAIHEIAHVFHYMIEILPVGELRPSNLKYGTETDIYYKSDENAVLSSKYQNENQIESFAEQWFNLYHVDITSIEDDSDYRNLITVEDNRWGSPLHLNQLIILISREMIGPGSLDAYISTLPGRLLEDYGLGPSYSDDPLTAVIKLFNSLITNTYTKSPVNIKYSIQNLEQYEASTDRARRIASFNYPQKLTPSTTKFPLIKIDPLQVYSPPTTAPPSHLKPIHPKPQPRNTRFGR